MKILLTNDDSHSSPLLKFIIDYLADRSELTIVVPSVEQSWTGKSMNSVRTLGLEEIELFGHKAYTVDGTPADCANIGIHHLCEEKPDLLVSGINIGLNSGLSFVCSSGTVGAAFEANLSGVPSIALSQVLSSELMQSWRSEHKFVEQERLRLEKQASTLLAKVFAVFDSNPELLQAWTTWNVNLPFKAASPCELKICSLGTSCYGSCFEKQGIHFSHGLGSVEADPSPSCDSYHVWGDNITVTPIDLRQLGQVEQQRASELKALFNS